MRKFLAILLVMLFGILAVPAFLTFALSRTLLSTSFYQNQALRPTYQYLVTATAGRMIEDSELLAAKFSKDELIAAIKPLFTEGMFAELMSDFSVQLADFQVRKSEAIDVSLLPLRQSLLTLANNIAYGIYQELPTCVTVTATKIPTCVPEGVSYERIIAPIKDDIEVAVYNSVPENFSGLEKVLPLHLFLDVKYWEIWQLAGMLVILGLIAWLVYKPWTTFFAYLGAALATAGVLGAAMAVSFEYLFKTIGRQAVLGKIGLEEQKLILVLTGYTANEVLRLSIVFLVMALSLLVLSLLLKKLSKNALN